MMFKGKPIGRDVITDGGYTTVRHWTDGRIASEENLGDRRVIPPAVPDEW